MIENRKNDNNASSSKDSLKGKEGTQMKENRKYVKNEISDNDEDYDDVKKSNLSAY